MQPLDYRAMTCCKHAIIQSILAIEYRAFAIFGDSLEGDVFLVDVDRFHIAAWLHQHHVTGVGLANRLLDTLPRLDHPFRCMASRLPSSKTYRDDTQAEYFFHLGLLVIRLLCP
ncbi:hypothetical protein D9M68_767370 [compost metagenome]